MAEQFPSETLREIADRARLALGADRALVLPLAGGDPLPPGPEGGPSLSAPIRIDGDPVATLVVSRDPGGAPFGEESGLLSTVCDLAAHAIAASRRADLRTEQLALVQAVASAVSAATAVDEAFRMAATVVFEHTRYSGVTATMVDRAAKQQLVVVDLGGDIATTQPIRRDLEAGLVGACIREATQLVLAEATADPRYSWSADGRWESLLLTPVMVEGRCEGVLELADSEPNRFDAADAALMQVAADQVATALVGVRLRERSTRLQNESQRRAQRLELASDLSREIASTGSVEELLRTVTVTLHRHTDYTAVWTAVADHRQGHAANVDDHTGPRRGHGVGAPARLGHHRAGRADGATGAARPVAPGRRRRGVGRGRIRVAARDPGRDRPPLRSGDRPQRPAGRPVRRLRRAAHADARRAGRRRPPRRGAARGVRPPRHPAERGRGGRACPAGARDRRAGTARRRPGDQPLHGLLRAHRLARGARLGRAPGGLRARPRHRCLHRAARPHRRRHPGSGDHRRQGAAPRPGR